MPGSILENTVDPPLAPPKHHIDAAPQLARIESQLPKTGAPVTLLPITPAAVATGQLPLGIVRCLHEEFAAEIERGCTYPMEEAMTFDKFRDYWFGTFAVVALRGSREEVDARLSSSSTGKEEEDWKDVCLGTFYIKPNYPGRCSHVCNAGFLTCAAARGQGTGSVMGKAYLEYAPKLGYKYSIFNLVFANNPASIRIWDKLGFQVLGRVPQAGRLANSEELVDALIYGRSLV